MPHRILLLPVVALLLAVDPVAGQTLAGRVVEAGSGTPVPGSFVVLLDSDGARVAAGLTGPEGGFVLHAQRPGSYQVRVQRIGYRGTTTDPVGLGRDQQATLLIEVPGEAVELEGLRVEGEGRCVLRPEEGEATYALWTEARKALEVAEWTVRGRPLRYHLLLFERLLEEGTEVVIRETLGRLEPVGEQPFTSHDPDSLAAHGYVQRREGLTIFHGPDARVLLSDVFLDTHCFRRVHGGSALVGLAFSPEGGAAAGGAVVGLTGTPYEVAADERGRFAIDGLTAGRYRLEATHPKLGRRPIVRVVELARGGTTRVRLER